MEIPDVGVQCEQKKQHAQHVLALGGPGHGLDIDRVESEQSGDHQAAPSVSGCDLQKQKKKHGVGRVQQHIRVVMSGRFQAEQFAVESVGQPGERMPVRFVIGGECPFHRRPRETGLYLRIAGDVAIVVVVEESVAGYGAVRNQHKYSQQQAQEQGALAR